MLDKTPQFCFITRKNIETKKKTAHSQEMTAFYIYARKIKISLFVMAKYRFWAAFSRGKVHDEMLAQEHHKYARNYILNR